MEKVCETQENYNIGLIFQKIIGTENTKTITSKYFSRSEQKFTTHANVIIDEFPDAGNAPSCCFLRLNPGNSRIVRFEIRGNRQITSCSSGGWLLEANDNSEPSFWLPQPPLCRTFDVHARILSEENTSIVRVDVSSEQLAVEMKIPEGKCLDWVIWKLDPGKFDIKEDLKHPLHLESQPTFTWSSQAICRSPADIFLYLIHGQVYQNANAWPRKWKFCCELDAYELYIRLSGLELATNKKLYSYLKRQILFSVISRQSQDGGWYHGEWTDICECHYRFHSGALLLLENALQEWPDLIILESLSNGASFVASRTDNTNLGPWFLHDTLEESADLMDEMPKMFAKALPNQVGRGAWKPSTFLGKSVTNKLVFNTHVDTTIALDRYLEVSGDDRYKDLVTAALKTTLNLLHLRPAESLYTIVYRMVYLTLLPTSDAQMLPLPVRALKRLSWKYLIPRLYKLKWMYPRIVMPGGFIDRHLSPLHFDAKYHAVNVMDLVRLWRRFPEADLSEVIDNAIEFVVGKNKRVLNWWADEKPRRFAIVVFAEALYHLCMIKQDIAYRRHLMESILLIENLGLGLPPSLLGGNSEITEHTDQVQCPSPENSRIRIINLCSADRKEFLLINPTGNGIELKWEHAPEFAVCWESPDNPSFSNDCSPLVIPPRSWLVGKGD